MSDWTLTLGSYEDRKKYYLPRNLTQLRQLLEQALRSDDSNFELINQSGDRLTVAMRPLSAYVLFRRSAFQPPSLSASENPKEKGTLEFHVGGTPSPIPKSRCVSVEMMKRIVEYFFEHETLPDWVTWLEE